MRIWHPLLALAAALLLIPSCDDSLGGGESGEEAVAKAKATSAPPIVIVIDQPEKHAHRGDSTYRLQPLEDGNFRLGKIDIDAKYVTPLLAAADKNLIPADTMKSCEPSPENVGVNITIPRKEGGDLKLISTADCLHFAPWNVIKDGKLYVQLTGEIGKALPELGFQVEQILWENWTLPDEGRINLSEGTPAPEGVEAQTLPFADFQAKLLENAVYKANFGDAVPESVRYVCSQKQSPDCSQLMGIASIPYKDMYTLNLGFDVGQDGIKDVHWPADDKVFANFMKSRPVELLKSFRPKKVEEPIYVEFSQKGDCRKMTPGISDIKEDANPEACSYIYMRLEYEGAERLPPELFYYPELDAMVLKDRQVFGTDFSFYKKLKASKTDLADLENDIRYEKFYWYVDRDGKVTKVRKS